MSSETIPPGQQDSQAEVQADLLNQLQVAEYQRKQLQAELAVVKAQLGDVLAGTPHGSWEKALQALKENEERLRLVIDSAQIGVWDFDPHTGKLMWDARCKALFGMAPHDHTDYDVFLRGLHPADRQKVHDANQDALNGLGNGEYDLEYRTIGLRDNKLRWIRAKGRSYRDERGVCIRYAGTVMDITDEKEQQQRLREQEERFRLLATSIPQIIWTTDQNGVVDYISDKWQQYTGHMPTHEAFSFRHLIHPHDVNQVVAAWNDCLKRAIPYRAEYRLKDVKTNGYRWYNCTVAPLKDDTGKVIKWVGSATDIQDQKTTEQVLENKVAERTKELGMLNEQLERSNAELEQYAYAASHDLKEPLRKIESYQSLIQVKHAGQLPPDVTNYLSKIGATAGRMSDFIDELLNNSKLSTADTLFDVVDLTTTVQNVIAEFEFALKERNITVEAMPLPVITAVPLHMHQLFFNLFSNAIKFSKRDSPNKIKISCAALSETDAQQIDALKTPGRHYKICFEDEGIGFSDSSSEQIFGIFQRLNSHRDYAGHGIGLALCRKIVANHHGIISAYGRENQGAAFTIILPEGQATDGSPAHTSNPPIL